MSARHLGLVLDWRGAVCGAVLTEDDRLPTSNEDVVECKACLAIMAQRGGHRPVTQEERMADQRRQWTIETVAGDTDLGLIDWLKEKMGVGTPTPLHTPPYMADNDDGLFIFHDVDHTHPDRQFRQSIPLEVVPQESGNVEMVLAGVMFTLHHLDRADLIRALLHDFHYSPERGGPNDD